VAVFGNAVDIKLPLLTQVYQLDPVDLNEWYQFVSSVPPRWEADTNFLRALFRILEKGEPKFPPTSEIEAYFDRLGFHLCDAENDGLQDLSIELDAAERIYAGIYDIDKLDDISDSLLNMAEFVVNGRNVKRSLIILLRIYNDISNKVAEELEARDRAAQFAASYRHPRVRYSMVAFLNDCQRVYHLIAAIHRMMDDLYDVRGFREDDFSLVRRCAEKKQLITYQVRENYRPNSSDARVPLNEWEPKDKPLFIGDLATAMLQLISDMKQGTVDLGRCQECASVYIRTRTSHDLYCSHRCADRVSARRKREFLSDSSGVNQSDRRGRGRPKKVRDVPS